MSHRHTVQHGGATYLVERRASREVTPGAPVPGGGDVWEVTRDGASITSFPASGDDDAASIREKVTGWLRANQDRPDAEIGRN